MFDEINNNPVINIRRLLASNSELYLLKIKKPYKLKILPNKNIESSSRRLNF